MCGQTGLIHSQASVRTKDNVAFLLKARVGDTTCAQAVVASCDKVKRRRVVPTSSDWKARISAAGVARVIQDVTRELQEHIEVECEFLGVLKETCSPETHGATVPGDVRILTASDEAVVVILCAPLNDHEWYCHASEHALHPSGLFLADLCCEVQYVCADALRRGAHLLELANVHREAFRVTVAAALTGGAALRPGISHIGALLEFPRKSS